MRRGLARGCRNLGRTLGRRRHRRLRRCDTTNLPDGLGGDRTRRALDPRAPVSRPPGPDRLRISARQSPSIDPSRGAARRDLARRCAGTDRQRTRRHPEQAAHLRSPRASRRDAGITVSSGTIALQFPTDAWIDLEAAANALDEAEGAFRRGDTIDALEPRQCRRGDIQAAIPRRREAPWIESQRSALRGCRCARCSAS